MKILLAILVVVCGQLSAADFMMVWKKNASLYNEQGRNILSLGQGEIVEAITHPKDRSLLMLKYKGTKYNSPASHYKTLDEMAAFYKKRLIEIEGILKEQQLEISVKSSEIDLMYVKSLELRRDTAISYKKVSLSNGSSYVGYRSSLSEGKYKKLMKEWEVSFQKVSSDFKKSHQLQRALMLEQDLIKGQLAGLDSKIKAFSEGKKPSHRTLFVANKKGARLFKDNKLVKHLAYGETAPGVKDSKNTGWFKILVNDKVYLVSGEDVKDKDEYLKLNKSSFSKVAYDIVYLEEQIEKKQFRLKLVNGISRQLEAEKFVAGGYGVVKNYTIPINKDRSFTLESPDATKLYINTTRANRILKEWKEEALELSGDSLKMQKRVVDLKKSLIDYEKAIKSLSES